jgi:hypothetical protein
MVIGCNQDLIDIFGPLDPLVNMSNHRFAEDGSKGFSRKPGRGKAGRDDCRYCHPSKSRQILFTISKRSGLSRNELTKGSLKNNPAEAGQNWRPDLGRICSIRNCPVKSGTESGTISRTLRLRIGQRWPEDGMRKCQVIFERALSPWTGQKNSWQVLWDMISTLSYTLKIGFRASSKTIPPRRDRVRVQIWPIRLSKTQGTIALFWGFCDWAMIKDGRKMGCENGKLFLSEPPGNGSW